MPDQALTVGDIPSFPRIFSGLFRHSVDAKNRLTIPADWRTSENEVFFCVPNHNSRYLNLMPVSEFTQVGSRLEKDPKIAPQDKALLIRNYYSQAQRCVMDRHGRMVLPDDHCERVGLVTEAVLVGMDCKFQIWSPGKWDLTQREEEARYRQLATQVFGD